MLIDWFTVGAQIVNFLVLVYLLKRFLYGPIINAMEKREEKIANRLKEADQKRAEAEEEVNAYRRKSRELDDSRDEILDRARQEADSLKKELIKKVREEVEEQKERWHEALNEEKEAFLKELKRRTGMQIYSVANRALADLADVELEQYMAEVFIKKIQRLDKEKRKKISDSIKKSGHETVAICSAFEIPKNEKQKITKAIHEYIMEGIEVDYRISQELLCGVELRVDSYVIGWNLEDYLKQLQEDASRVLEDLSGGSKNEGEDKRR